MGKLFGIVAVAGLVWVGLEFYSKGSAGAFGGIFESWTEPVSSYRASSDGRTPVQRIGDRVQSDINSGAERRERGVRRNQ